MLWGIESCPLLRRTQLLELIVRSVFVFFPFQCPSSSRVFTPSRSTPLHFNTLHSTAAMSQKRGHDGEGEDGDSTKKARHEEQQQEQQQDPEPEEPTQRTLLKLFGDGLEVIFSFLSASDLAKLMGAHRAFKKFLANAKNKRIRIQAHALVRNPRLYGNILESTVLTHRVRALTLEKISVCARIATLFPHLTELNYLEIDTSVMHNLCVTSGMRNDDWSYMEFLLWPQQLQKLRFTCSGKAPGNQLLIDIVAYLSTLTQLDLQMDFTELRKYSQRVDLQPLAELPNLRSLTSVREDFYSTVDLPMRETFCASLAKVLRRLPQLTVLHLSWERPSAMFFAQLPNLTDLFLLSRQLNPDPLLLQLQTLTKLTSLHLQFVSFTSDHLSQLLPELNLLTELTLTHCEDLSSSDYLATPSLADTLTRLTLVHSSMGHSLEHYSKLDALLYLSITLADDPTPEDLAEWRKLRPGGVLPRLAEFRLRVQEDEVDEEEEIRDAFAPPPAAAVVGEEPPPGPSSDSDVEIVKVVQSQGH